MHWLSGIEESQSKYIKGRKSLQNIALISLFMISISMFKNKFIDISTKLKYL